MEQAPLSKVIAPCDVLYNWKTIILIKHVNFKLPKHLDKGNHWKKGIPNVQEVQMFIQTYLKFYQEYFKMVCSVLKGSFSGIEFVKKLPIGPFSQIRSQIALSPDGMYYCSPNIAILNWFRQGWITFISIHIGFVNK